MMPVIRQIFCVSQSKDLAAIEKRQESLADKNINLILGAQSGIAPDMVGTLTTNGKLTAPRRPVLELDIPAYGGNHRSEKIIKANLDLIVSPDKGFHRFTNPDPALTEDPTSSGFEDAFNWHGEQTWLRVLSIINDHDRSSGVIKTRNIAIIAHRMMLSFMAISASFTHTENLKLGGRIWYECDCFVMTLRGIEVTKIEFLEPVSEKMY